MKKSTKKTSTRIEVIYHGQSVRGTEEFKASESQLLWNIVLYLGPTKLVKNRPIWMRPVAFYPATPYIKFDRSTIDRSVFH